MPVHPAMVGLRAARRGAGLLVRGGVVAAALLAGACVTPSEHGPGAESRAGGDGGSPSGQVEAEVATLREQSQRTDATLAQLKSRLDALEASTRNAAQTSQGEVSDELKGLRTTLDEYGQRLAAVEQSVAQPRKSGAAARRPPEKPARRATPEATASQPPPAPSAVVPLPANPGARQDKTSTSQDKTSVLAFAREQELKGDKAVARGLYEQYAADYPTDPATAEAHFRLGELAFGERRYRDAIAEFGKVATEFPRSDRAPDALLRTGESMIQLDMKDDAATLLAQIPQRYPGTTAATRAKKDLAELKGAGAGK
ncbi:tetratricopeptide repeat protein [Anaeromyxobacter oryzae]|uniref:Cell division coordinator CpoB n=1 Tax=Anaeromyxobacter oryzae TaxID=2918170 RepID=A0ABN6MW41_9BACT|nr:tetratricopeptide repeat protein [Anaeromyxobacter oryzae]BDG05202.1 hypothetical protein AMOR_41980 [Anaeromyxobacter oryzae]